MRHVQLPAVEVPALHTRAMDELRYIRQTMERAASFTAVPGWGGVLMGVSALFAAVIAARETQPQAWISIWLREAVAATSIGLYTLIRKARVGKIPLFSGPGLRFFLSFSPPLIVGALLTVSLCQAGTFRLLPGTWLLLYGTGVVTGGAFSVKIVPVMGFCFIGLGTVALFGSFALGNWFMAAGFGGLQIVFGTMIARRFGG